MAGNERIVGRQDASGMWSAWFASDPLGARSAESPFAAVGRLLEDVCQPLNQWDTDGLSDAESMGSFEIRPLSVCPDCGGSGQYVGFSSIDVCQTCAGTGKRGAQYAL
jgi:hypothetical protein